MATIQRPCAKDLSTWEYIRKTASERLSAFLTGQYSYTFSNTADKTVKLHLADDVPGTGGKQDFFLTVPARASGIEIPMKCDLISVTAGFFHPTTGTYEIFWENRRFSWESGMTISIGNRHSVDANKFRVDVYPNAAEVPKKFSHKDTYSRDKLHCMHMLMLPGHTRGDNIEAGAKPRVASELTVYSRRLGSGASSGTASTGSSWIGSSVSRALPDGSLEVSDCDGTTRRVNPAEEVALVALPPGITDWAKNLPAWPSGPSTISSVGQESLVSDMAPPPAHLRHPREKIVEAAGDEVESYYSFSTFAPSTVAPSTPAPRRLPAVPTVEELRNRADRR